MASREAIARGIALLHECFPSRPITDETGNAFALVFADTSDREFLTACANLAKQPGRVFFPTTGELQAALKPRAPIDLDRLCDAISSLGEYNPNVGWIYPRTQTVIDRFGAAIGAAYAHAGCARIFSDNETSRDIARREFAGALDTAPIAQIESWFVGAKRLQPPAPLMLPPTPPKVRGPAGPTWTDLKGIRAIADTAEGADA